MFWCICLIVAGALCVGVLLCDAISWLRKKWTPKTRFYMSAAGAFLAVFVLLIPYCWEKAVPEISRIISAFYSTAQAFTFNFSVNDIARIIASMGSGSDFFVWYSRFLTCLVLICPLFTIGFFLSFIKDFWAKVRLAFHFRKTAFVFSELNEMTIAVAESVSKEKRGLVVFADAFAKENDSPELLEKAAKMHALCFRNDITHLPLRKMERGFKFWLREQNKRKHAREVRFILLSNDQSKALSQGLNLEKMYKNRPDASAVVYSSSPAAGLVIDAKANPTAAFSKIFLDSVRADQSDTKQLWSKKTWEPADFEAQTGFYLRRFDPTRHFVQSTLTSSDLVNYLHAAAKESHVVSIMIVGYGSYGSEIMKNAVWMYQQLGSKVEINIIDKRRKAETEYICRQECPGLFETHTEDGEAAYSICFIEKIDTFSSLYTNLFEESSKYAERLRRTQVVFVTLGDDDQNIAAALQIRTMFDRIQGLSEKKYNDEKKGDCSADVPWIYSIVYDEEKYTNLQAGAAAQAGQVTDGLMNYKEQEYRIRFIGNLTSIYSIHALALNDEWERDALTAHLEWMQIAHLTKRMFYEDQSFHDQLIQAYAERTPDKSADEINEIAVKAVENTYDGLYKPGTNEFVDDWESILNEALKDYYHYEYYRLSSIAKHLYRTYLTPDIQSLAPSAKRKQEHMRWNAYMRSLGYRKGKRFDRAKLHHDLIPFSKLDPIEQMKD